MSTSRKNRFSFRPSLGDVTLEERVVMSTTPASIRAAAMFPGGGSGVAPRELQQTRLEYIRQLRVTNQVLRNYVQAQTQLLNQNGAPSAENIANFRTNIAGAINASAYNLSSQAQLLPGGTRLADQIQNSLLGNSRNSLNSRIDALLSSRGTTGANIGRLAGGLNQVLNTALGSQQYALNNYFNSTPIARLAVDQNTGARVGLNQYMGQQVVNQFNNSLGALANNVGPLAQSMLYANGTPDQTAINNFGQMYGNALNTAAFQLGNNLQLFRNTNPTLYSQLNQGFFGTGNDATTGQPINSFFGGIGGLFNNTNFPQTATDFTSTFQNAIGNAYNGVAGSLYNNFGITPTYGQNGNIALPNGYFQNNTTFPGVFNNNFAGSNFNNGFNNGFATTGTGFPGFGQTPTNFNNNFGTGFNNYVATTNQNLLFSGQPYGYGGSFGTGFGNFVGGNGNTGFGGGFA